ncbi:hypothetical protein Q2V57_12040 [Enterobacter bugandensis]|uniref:Uncharacterized protein n=2 Tax=Enterobacter bugandensis TaxID=881260 RepID=A0ABX4VSL7_9ENTR|nr:MULTISPECIES: hypothetical protein [Enterobacter]MBF2746761.1 hypothetical protein [Enterobacter bugandensis]MBF2799406.1 hypothetical protein [Enterobacter bugandensis]MBZ6368178.1 hypothetical protein [Enterobacter bugandensis]MCK6761358.1 hypothetical protein [Enterobacter bugandensis]MCK6832463.1 hypothetical protein [Enterobacter bugandensis]
MAVFLLWQKAWIKDEIMKWTGFIIFILIALVYIWNGKDLYTLKEWRDFRIKFISVLVGALALTLILVGVSKSTPLLDRESARAIALILPASLVAMLLSKFFVVMLNAIFESIMRFHKRYNTKEMYLKLSSLSARYGAKLHLVAKCLASLGCILMLYGIWFGSTG